MAQQTRLGLYGGPRQTYDSFAGKVFAVIPVDVDIFYESRLNNINTFFLATFNFGTVGITGTFFEDSDTFFTGSVKRFTKVRLNITQFRLRA